MRKRSRCSDRNRGSGGSGNSGNSGGNGNKTERSAAEILAVVAVANKTVVVAAAEADTAVDPSAKLANGSDSSKKQQPQL